ncbi:MAG TPA: MDR family oxidoreductase [Bryobacteraceae bacterium]|nr:MDR family oxidoreductase [Bryobacteraceae bacterium]
MRGWLLTKSETGIASHFGEIDDARLPAGDVQVRVEWSSLNYKDGLAMTGSPGVVRTFPMVPGIDLAGVVEESTGGEFAAGQHVVVTGCGLSETHWGGYAEKARLPLRFVVPLPEAFTARQSMAIGTAGFTAMQCVDALERHGLRPGGREVVVTGAAGGVGSVAVAILAGKGYRVVASTGRMSEADYLRRLGAAEVIDRAELSATGGKPMESERWGGAVDTVGGDTLAGVIRTLSHGTAVAACGLAGGGKLQTTVFPFILRGVSLLGVNSVEVANEERRRIWGLLAEYLDRDLLDSITSETGLEELPEAAAQILAGKVRGRMVVRI